MKPLCFHCGNECSGDVTETVEIYDGLTAEKPICDNPDECPENKNMTPDLFGQTVTVDHFTEKFTVIIRSLNGVGVEDLKDLIQTKYEVVTIVQNDSLPHYQ